MIEPDAFTLGETIAVTEGSVVFWSEVFELIQYAPQTDQVWSVPLLMVPPVINKFYIMDIAPGRSMIEYFLRQGMQVFAISWRNPTAEHGTWGFDTYGQAILDALDAVQTITNSDRTHLQASCSGGILAAMTAAHLTASGEDDRLASLTLMVTVLDQQKGRIRRGRDRRAGREYRDRPVGPQGLSGRPVAGGGVRLAAPDRPDLAILGEQLRARASRRPHSMCCSGTPTPPGWRPRCIGTW